MTSTDLFLCKNKDHWMSVQCLVEWVYSAYCPSLHELVNIQIVKSSAKIKLINDLYTTSVWGTHRTKEKHLPTKSSCRYFLVLIPTSVNFFLKETKIFSNTATWQNHNGSLTFPGHSHHQTIWMVLHFVPWVGECTSRNFITLSVTLFPRQIYILHDKDMVGGYFQIKRCYHNHALGT